MLYGRGWLESTRYKRSRLDTCYSNFSEAYKRAEVAQVPNNHWKRL